MKDLLWLAAILFLIFPGAILWRLPSIKRLDLPARLATALAGGIAMAAALLYLYSLIQMPWTRFTVGAPLIAIGVGKGFRISGWGKGRASTSTLIILLFAALTFYGVATARETCGDLIFFWGPKGQRFHLAGKIDVDFLGYRHYSLMHSDYPPLLPLTYAWASLVAHRFSWWGALYITPIALLATAFAFRGFAREAIGEERAGWYAALLAAILGHGFAVGMVAGAAEPVLLLFEVIAVGALTFAGEQRDAQIVAAVMLAAAAVTKVEGAGFVAMVVLAYAITSRRITRAIAISLPAAAALGSWLFFVWRHHLTDMYTLARGTLHFKYFGAVLGTTLKQASYGAAYVPWLATLAPLAVRRNLRRSLFPILVAIGSIALALFYYLHSDAPWWWIRASAQRVLLTPLVCLVVASAAASE